MGFGETLTKEVKNMGVVKEVGKLLDEAQPERGGFKAAQTKAKKENPKKAKKELKDKELGTVIKILGPGAAEFRINPKTKKLQKRPVDGTDKQWKNV